MPKRVSVVYTAPLTLTVSWPEKDVFRLFTSVGQRKKFHYTEPQRLHGERGLLRSSYDTRLAYRLGSAMSIVAQWKSIEARKSEGLRFDSSWGEWRIFTLSYACDKKKNVFLFSLIALKTYHLS